MAKDKPSRTDKEATTRTNKERRVLKNNGPEALAKWKSDKLKKKVHG